MVLVTVGSTHFEELIKVVDTQEFVDFIWERGYKKLVIQYGPKAKHIPGPAIETICENKDVELECFAQTSEFAKYMQSADLIISHAGAGSIMEGLSLGKAMMVVVNDTLMHNHQVELALAMSENQHAYYTNPRDLLNSLATADFSSLAPLPPAQTHAFGTFLDRAMGF
jgi:beta-1,4-N-acetylglucosaminyltransferase